jgi:hypothetical protein
MNFDEFIKEFTERLRESMGNEYRFTQQTSDGMNGTVRHSLTIIHPDSSLHPCIHMEEQYEYYKLVENNMELTIERILTQLKEHTLLQDFDLSTFDAWDLAKQHIYGKLINTKENGRQLVNIPNRNFLDLSLVYYFRVPLESKEGHYAVIQIDNRRMQSWDVDEDTLYRVAMENMDAFQLFNMQDYLMEALDTVGNDIIDTKDKLPLYVLTNESRRYGAAEILNPDALRHMVDLLKDDFWILPSSIHEFIIIPVHFGHEAAELERMVEQVNNTQLPLNEILSFHVYRYSRETGEITIAI